MEKETLIFVGFCAGAIAAIYWLRSKVIESQKEEVLELKSEIMKTAKETNSQTYKSSAYETSLTDFDTVALADSQVTFLNQIISNFHDLNDYTLNVGLTYVNNPRIVELFESLVSSTAYLDSLNFVLSQTHILLPLIIGAAQEKGYLNLKKPVLSIFKPFDYKKVYAYFLIKEKNYTDVAILASGFLSPPQEATSKYYLYKRYGEMHMGMPGLYEVFFAKTFHMNSLQKLRRMDMLAKYFILLELSQSDIKNTILIAINQSGVHANLQTVYLSYPITEKVLLLGQILSTTNAVTHRAFITSVTTGNTQNLRLEA